MDIIIVKGWKYNVGIKLIDPEANEKKLVKNADPILVRLEV